ncbi:cytochrome P450 4F12 [Linderina pennispora]|uniref:Cytochrome P450 4F12 n=1 Tax=Linderina pennispora TaxID=61395 RepID=A0A1Y1WCQ6_9FUNG|nr:cytochrome P450 4F12 [Linderina pennispora]ORX71323.1 cytochrome P450 4F12 [Linderina pennispora]
MVYFDIFSIFDKDKLLSSQIVWATAAAFFIGYVTYAFFLSFGSQFRGPLIARFGIVRDLVVFASGTFADVCEDDYYRYGDIYHIGANRIALSNVSDCRRVLASHDFRKPRFRYQAFDTIGPNMLSNTVPEISNIRRRQIGPMFRHGYLAEMEPAIKECSIKALKAKWDRLIDDSGGTAVVNYYSDFLLIVFDIISTLGFDYQFRTLENNGSQIVKWVDDVHQLNMYRILFAYPARFPATLFTGKSIKGVQDFLDFGNRITEERRKQVEAGMEPPKDILQALIDAVDPVTKEKLTTAEITAENIILLMAGTNSASYTMAWFLHYMMLYPDIYKRAVDEVRSAFPQDHCIGYTEGRTKLPFLDACIYEVMRIRGVTSVIFPREVPAGGASFQGYHFPAGTSVFLNFAGLNHNKDVWGDPRNFRPDRFIENENLKQNVFTFSSGVRVCPGRSLAHFELYTVLANLLKDYDFKLPEGSPWGPDNVDKFGNPIPMPRTFVTTVRPKYPERDCNVLITKAA